MDTIGAGLAYAAAGFYVLPVSRATKHAGSVLGKGWPAKSSRDPDQIVAWFAASDECLAFHVGRSGAVAFDIDRPGNLPPVMTEAFTRSPGPFQRTRAGDPHRGHRLYRVPAGRMLGNSAGSLGKEWGEVRGRNGIIVVEPSIHENTADGGQYQWTVTGEVPELPATLADALPDVLTADDAASDTEIARFVAEHTASTRPRAILGPVRRFQAEIAKDGARHNAALESTLWAAKEARAGYYPAAAAFASIGVLFRQALAEDIPGHKKRTAAAAAGEYAGIIAWSVAQAKAADLTEVRRIAERDDLRPFTPPFTQPAPPMTAPAADGELATIAAAYQPVNWREAWKAQPEDVHWLVPGFLEAGTANALFASPGTGKSLLAQEIASDLARQGITVVYIDDENRIADLVERLQDMGREPDDLDRLLLYSFAGLPPLDTPEGGKHLEALAATAGAQLVILDTTSRMVAGRENDADTFLQLYRCSLVPLKGRGITSLRLDHPGKDAAKGQRGSSAKDGDVDTVWRLEETAKGTRYQLERLKSRSGHGEPAVRLRRHANPLRHDWEAAEPGSSNWIIAKLDELGVPRDAGRDKARAALSAAGLKAGTDDLRAALRARKLTFKPDRSGPAAEQAEDHPASPEHLTGPWHPESENSRSDLTWSGDGQAGQFLPRARQADLTGNRDVSHGQEVRPGAPDLASVTTLRPCGRCSTPCETTTPNGALPLCDTCKAASRPPEPTTGVPPACGHCDGTGHCPLPSCRRCGHGGAGGDCAGCEGAGSRPAGAEWPAGSIGAEAGQ